MRGTPLARPSMSARLYSLLLVVSLALSACGTSQTTMMPPAPGADYGAAEGVVAQRGEGMARADPSGATVDRQLVRDAALTLKVDRGRDIAPLVERARALTASVGGFVAFEGPRELTLRIPDARLEGALDTLSAYAADARREVRVLDVTSAATDLQVRLDNARALRDRLRALLAQASSVADAVAVERELARATTEVEQLEAQMRELQSRIAFSTVHVRIHDSASPGPIGWVFVGLYEAVRWLFVWV